jgi:hypothetical protein
MSAIFRQAARVGAIFAALYALTLGLSLLAFPLPVERGGSLYSHRAPSSVYRMEPRYIVLNRAPLATGDPMMMMLGASNVVLPFDPVELQPLVPVRSVHNLAIGGANITEIREVVELIREVVPRPALGRQTYVLGIWYGLFIDDKTRWRGGPTDIDIERLRYGLYRRSGTAFEPVVPPAWIPTASIALRPLLALDVAVKGTLRPLRQWLADELPPPDLDAVLIDDAKKEKLLRDWAARVGTPDGRLRDEQFEALVGLVRELVATGARIVLIDLPLPEWHRTRSPSFADYRQRLPRYLAELEEMPGVSYRNWQTAFPDSEFYDEVHPRPRANRAWVEHLARTLAAPSGIRLGDDGVEQLSQPSGNMDTVVVR